MMLLCSGCFKQLKSFVTGFRVVADSRGWSIFDENPKFAAVDPTRVIILCGATQFALAQISHVPD